MAEIQTKGLSRRRLITIAAAAVALPGMATARPRRFEWRGGALGAEARIILHHPDKVVAEAAIAASLAEISRLESEFSLYETGSALRRLNAHSVLANPSHDMRRLLHLCQQFGDLSHGAFDPSVQPLWRLYADHFGRFPDRTAGPSADAVAETRQHVDYRHIAIDADQIRLKPGMALTLNGIAQGYITDRVADLLHRMGWRDVLLNLGEIRALPGRGWSVGLEDDGPRLTLRNAALATSSGSSSPFAAPDGPHHLLNPANGHSGRYYRSVSVLARTAVDADALSTALFLTPLAQAQAVLRAGGGETAWLRLPNGQMRVLRNV